MIVLKKKIFFIIILILFLISVVIFIKDLKKPIVLDEEYINSEVLIGMDSIEEILVTDKNDDYVVCVCKVDNKQLMFLLLENNKYYDMVYKNTFSTNTFNLGQKEFFKDIFVTKNGSIIKYGFSPVSKSDSLKNNNKVISVQEFEYFIDNKTVPIVFWWEEN